MGNAASGLRRLAASVSFGIAFVVLGAALSAPPVAKASTPAGSREPPPTDSQIDDNNLALEIDGLVYGDEQVNACGMIVGDPSCDTGDDGDIGTEGRDPTGGEDFGPEFDSIGAGFGVVDPIEMGGLDALDLGEGGELGACARGKCDDGGVPFDPISSVSPEDLDLCALGLCAVDPVEPEDGNQGEAEEGDLDLCQISIKCEKGDSEGQGGASADDGECEDGDDDDECTQSREEEDDSDSSGPSQYEESPYTDDHSGASQYDSDPYKDADSGTDSDGDGLTDYVEKNRYTDPHNPDSDGDGLWDSSEFSYGTNPWNADTDGDGLTDYQETGGSAVVDPSDPFDNWNTDPTDPDSDDDGWDDMQEWAYGSEPNTAGSTPCDFHGSLYYVSSRCELE